MINFKEIVNEVCKKMEDRIWIDLYNSFLSRLIYSGLSVNMSLEEYKKLLTKMKDMDDENI